MGGREGLYHIFFKGFHFQVMDEREGMCTPALQPPNVVSELATHNRQLNKDATDVTSAVSFLRKKCLQK